MDLAQSLVGGVFTIIGYVMVFLGVYKVFQIATDIHEIKEAVQSRKALDTFPASAPALPISVLDPGDSATAYAEKLLRAVNDESRTVETSSSTESH